MNIVVIASILSIIVSLAVQAFFAGAEMSIISANKIKISHLALKGDRRAACLEWFAGNPELFFGTTLVGANICVIIGSSLAAALASRMTHNPDAAASLSTALMLPLILVFGQIVPMSLARKHATALALVCARPLRAATSLLYPLVIIAGAIGECVSRIAGKGHAKKSHYVTRDELKLLLREGMKKGYVDEMIINMAYEVFDFGETDIEDIMVSLGHVVSTSTTATVGELASLIIDTGYSWIPIYSEWPDNIVGVVKATDLLVEDSDEKAVLVMRPCFVMRENVYLEEALKAMQREKKNFAIVADSTGRITGIVTLEDIIEEIVGEIEDEYAPAKTRTLRRIGQHSGNGAGDDRTAKPFDTTGQ